MRYYLAYGSNLNLDQMQYRCPKATPIGTAVIKGYELLFKGSKTGSYLTIEKNENEYVPVGVWEVNETEERKLDIYEGYPKKGHRGLSQRLGRQSAKNKRIRLYHARGQTAG